MNNTKCEWFARCTNDAAGLVAHPILGHVRTCARCAGLAERELLPFPTATYVLTHPSFGELERPQEAWVTDSGVAYVGGFWGPWRIFANLPASDLDAVPINS